MHHPSTVLRTGSKLVAEQSSSYSHILQGEAPRQNSCSTARSLCWAEQKCLERDVQSRAEHTPPPHPTQGTTRTMGSPRASPHTFGELSSSKLEDGTGALNQTE